MSAPDFTQLERDYLNYAKIYSLEEQINKAKKAEQKSPIAKTTEVSQSFFPLLISNVVPSIYKHEFKPFNDITRNATPSNSKVMALKSEIDELQEKITSNLCPVDAENINQLIIDLIGGKKAYTLLKDINLHNIVLSHGSIDFITPDNLIEPVAKFTDKLGRQGIAICAFKKNETTFKVQTFYQEMKNSPNWVCGGDTIIPVEGKYLIESGVVNSSAYIKLKSLLQNRKVTIEYAQDKDKTTEWILKDVK